MKRFVNRGTASLKALAVVVALGAMAHAGMPYLPLTGPPPLRMLAVKSPSAPVVKFTAAPAAPATNTLAGLAAKVFPGLTNATSSDAESSFLSAAGMTGADRSLEDTFNASVFALPTPDLLSITPQMLAAYFRPVQFGTNTALTGPFHVGFMPPLPLPLPVPVKSSHAEYIVK